MTKYYNGGGTPVASGDAKLFLANFLGGFPDAYEFVDIEDGGYITKGDPYWRFGVAGGDQVVEIGLWDDYRIQISDAGGIHGWNEGSSEWVDLLVGATGDHNLLSNLQGGQANEYYHLTNVQVVALHARYTNAEAQAVSINNVSEDASPTLGGDLACADKALTNIKSIAFNDGDATITEVKDEDNMASNSNTKICTQQSIKAYVDNHSGGGTYTGDGAGNGVSWVAKQSINLGTRPKFVMIVDDLNGDSIGVDVYTIMDYGFTEVAIRHPEAAAAHFVFRYLARITATGFDVADFGVDNSPNENGRAYRYFYII